MYMYYHHHYYVYLYVMIKVENLDIQFDVTHIEKKLNLSLILFIIFVL